MNWEQLDPTLPTLAQAFDSATALRLFTEQRSGHTAHQPSTRCRRQSVDYSPGDHCTATYLLSDDDAQWQTIGVVEATADRVMHRLFTDDPQLTSLGTAMDANGLERRFAADNVDLGQIDSVIPVRYKPGSRCTLRYQAQSARGHSTYFGKLLAQESDEVAQAVADLYHASQQTASLPAVARPLVYWPELQLLVQAAVEGEELHDVAFDATVDLTTRVGWMQAAGAATAALHNATIQLTAPHQTLRGDLGALDEYRPALRQLNPRLADRFAHAVDFAGQTAAHHCELAPVLSHGALRTDQFMIEEDHLVLIDLDSLCQSSPARDLGNFLAYLTWKALRQPQHAAFIQLGQEAFLAGYQQVQPLPDVHWIAIYQFASILKVIGRRYTGLTYREWPLTDQLLTIGLQLMESAH